MNELDPRVKEVVAIVEEAREAIVSGWEKVKRVSGKTDFLAFVEHGPKDLSVLIFPREAGIAFLQEKGCDTSHPNLQSLQSAATGLSLDATAIWVVVRMGDLVHIAKITNQPMTHGGSA